MKLHVISCEVLARECYQAAARSPHIISIELLPFGLHQEPDKLRATVQGMIDQASAGDYDYILLAYGLCSRGTAGLTARHIPVVIPRAHDCITLLLGSRNRYEAEFGGHPGTYYYSSGWIERREVEVVQGTMVVTHDNLYEQRYREYVEKYGEENAQYLIEQEKLWMANYNRAAFINTGVGDEDYYRQCTKEIAAKNAWEYEEVQGSGALLEALMSGEWTSSDFLIIEPGRRTVESVNAGIIEVE